MSKESELFVARRAYKTFSRIVKLACAWIIKQLAGKRDAINVNYIRISKNNIFYIRVCRICIKLWNWNVDHKYFNFSQLFTELEIIFSFLANFVYEECLSHCLLCWWLVRMYFWGVKLSLEFFFDCEKWIFFYQELN